MESNFTSVTITQGMRQYMEDTMLIESLGNQKKNIDMMCVFDGHGGSQVSSYCHEHFKDIFEKHWKKSHELDVVIRQTYKEMDDHCQKLKKNCGSTALTLLKRRNELWIANCGDSEAVLKIKMDNGEIMVKKISECHKVENEKERLQKEGAQITYDDGCARINRMLNVARSFGDYHLKQFVISTPYIKCIKYDPEANKKHNVQDLNYIILASDGVWDVYNEFNICQDIDHLLIMYTNEGKSLKKAVDLSSYDIVRRCIMKGSTDNITLVLHIL